MTRPSSARLVLQRISNKRDDAGICNPSSGAIVGRGLLVAVYVEPLAAGQDADDSVASVGGIAEVGLDCVTVTGALPVCVTGAGVSLFPLLAVGASLCRNKVLLFVFECTMTEDDLTWKSSTYAELPILHRVPRQWLQLCI